MNHFSNWPLKWCKIILGCTIVLHVFSFPSSYRVVMSCIAELLVGANDLVDVELPIWCQVISCCWVSFGYWVILLMPSSCGYQVCVVVEHFVDVEFMWLPSHPLDVELFVFSSLARMTFAFNLVLDIYCDPTCDLSLAFNLRV